MVARQPERILRGVEHLAAAGVQEKTVEVMQRCRVTALGMDAGRTLLFDRARVIEAADAAGIAIEAFPLEAIGVAERPATQGKQ